MSFMLVIFFLLASQAATPSPGMCSSTPSMSDPATGSRWLGWGAGIANTRYQPSPQSGLAASDVPKLKLKWAFGIPDAMQHRSQPAIAAGRMFFGSAPGIVYSIDAKTGCTYWTFKAQAGVRTAVSVGEYKAGGASGYAVYFTDANANTYAVDAMTGKQIWTRKLEDHSAARGTGAPILHDGQLYAPVAGVAEENVAARPQYECCTFRGSVSALDANTGAVIWKAYTITETPKPRGKSTSGAQLWGPAGAGVWSSPTIDVKRGSVYVATGNGYSDPPQLTSDAVIAFDLKTGKMKWASQVTPNDVWILGCGGRGQGPNPNCPEKIGPDYDFAAAPILASLPNGRDLIVVPQKSGVGYALDPDKEGAIVWQYRFGRGSGIGGVWGAAVDPQQAYFSAADYLTPAPGGIHGVRLETGERVWYTPPKPPLCGTSAGCSAAQSAAPTVIPGVVFSGSADGGIRAYSTKDGSIVWEFETNRDFETVNGVTAKGGSMDGPGPVVAGGMLYVTSGNGGLVGRPGNVLLAFGLE
jgi:polyvinyl alcohol dehydrogenase (cytochrome)